MSAEHITKLRDCWDLGMGLTETREAMSRAFGFRPEPETIRQHFVEFSDEFAQQAGRAA